MKTILMILISAALVNNAVIVRSEGLYQYFGLTNSRSCAYRTALIVAAITMLSAALCYPVNKYILRRFNAEYLQVLVFAFIIAVCVQACEWIINAKFPSAKKALGTFLPLLAADCAVLGLLTETASLGYNFGYTMLSAFGTSVGFAFALLILSSIRERLEFSDIPESFRGAPAALISAALVSLAFIGFTGMLEGMFGSF